MQKLKMKLSRVKPVFHKGRKTWLENCSDRTMRALVLGGLAAAGIGMSALAVGAGLHTLHSSTPEDTALERTAK